MQTDRQIVTLTHVIRQVATETSGSGEVQTDNMAAETRKKKAGV